METEKNKIIYSNIYTQRNSTLKSVGIFNGQFIEYLNINLRNGSLQMSRINN